MGSEVQILSSRPFAAGIVLLKEILLTNDDGIHSQGITALADALSRVARVTVVAPDREMSATSQSLTLQRPIRYEEIGPRRFSVEGTPTDCVIIALHHILSSLPALLISGINQGANLGHDIAYSGTVSAAMEGANQGIPAFAVSLAAWRNFEFDEAAQVAAAVADKIVGDPLPSGVILNVNVPGSTIRGVRITRQGHRNVRNLIVENQDPRGRKYFWIDQELDPENHGGNEDIDYVAVNSGYVSITPLKIDRTEREVAKKIEPWSGVLFRENQFDSLTGRGSAW